MSIILSATGVVEASWGSASLIGFPIIGILIQAVSWNSPLYILAGAAIPVIPISIVILRRTAKRKQVMQELIGKKETHSDPENTNSETINVVDIATQDKKMSVRLILKEILGDRIVVLSLVQVCNGKLFIFCNQCPY